MPTPQVALIEAFGRAVELGNAVIFVGAGLSQGARLPGWEKLLEAPSAESDVPDESDLPLKAEYIIAEGKYSRQRLEQHILETLVAPSPKPTSAHESLALLPVSQFWTTNYDLLLEQAMNEAKPVCRDDEVQLLGTIGRSIIKMHGSLTSDPAGGHVWASPPVITRSDYENYERNWPRTSALLRATYLSKTFLFLGFSFTDSNVEILLSLARRLGSKTGTQHLTVIRRPAPENVDELRLHELKVRDLEASGVFVMETSEHTDLIPLLRKLVRRTRPARVFISGSGESTDGDFISLCRAVGESLVDRIEWELCSLGGPAGWQVSRKVAHIRRAENTYSPEQIVTRFRKSTSPPPPMDERVGTAIFSDLERGQLFRKSIDESRAMVVIEGGQRTQEEIEWANSIGVGIVPLAGTGGAARDYWEQHRPAPPELGGQAVSVEIWERLGSSDPVVASRAAFTLLKQAMYQAV